MAPSSGFESHREISVYLKCSDTMAQILWRRGFRSTEAIEELLQLDLTRLPNPFSLYDMDRACDRVVEAILGDEQIAIYGDYDVDGTCGAVVLNEFLTDLGLTGVTVIQPNRFNDGYGVHTKLLAQLIESGHSLILTVDCGITANEPIAYAQAEGADVIVIDHHKLGAALPEAYAVVDPQRPEDTSGLRNLCGAGLAFFFVMALRNKLRAQSYFEARQQKEPNLMKLLDLVAVSTVADLVDIRGVNRILVKHGLRVLGSNPRPGLRALLEVNSIQSPTAMHCGFVLGPRINAAGRLKSARSAYELLSSQSVDEARVMAREIEHLNAERRRTQDSVYEAARAQALVAMQGERLKDIFETHPSAELGPWPRALVLAPPVGDEIWHEGVVGIVASKLVEEFERPVFVLTERHDAPTLLKGSVRSMGKIDILEAISTDSVKTHLLNFGGHAHAGGVTLAREALIGFERALNTHLALVADATAYERKVEADAIVGPEDLTPQLLRELEGLGPFGHQFPEPLFAISGANGRVTVMKEKHLKFSLVGNNRAGALDAVWFNAKQKEKWLSGKLPTRLLGNLVWNEWQGNKRLQVFIKHVVE